MHSVCVSWRISIRSPAFEHWNKVNEILSLLTSTLILGIIASVFQLTNAWSYSLPTSFLLFLLLYSFCHVWFLEVFECWYDSFHSRRFWSWTCGVFLLAKQNFLEKIIFCIFHMNDCFFRAIEISLACVISQNIAIGQVCTSYFIHVWFVRNSKISFAVS